MAAIHWLNPVSGSFTNASDWTGGVVPGASDDALLDTAGAAFTVTSSANEIVNSIDLATNAGLAITSGTFTASAGTGSGANAGTISVGDGATFKVGGQIAGSGLVSVTGAASDAALYLQSSVSLSGGGTVALSGVGFGHAADILGVYGVTLTNVDDTISGSGVVGASYGFRFTNDSAGVVDATTSALDFGAQADINNAGLMEATNGASLQFYKSEVGGSGGVILADGKHSYVNFVTAGVRDETLETKRGGGILFEFSNASVSGTINNHGLLQFESENSGPGSGLTILGNTTLTGGGRVRLITGITFLRGTSSSLVLTNLDNTIRGEGLIGDGVMTLVNAAGGVIESSDGVTRGAKPLVRIVIDTGTNTIVNAGLIETTHTGLMYVDSPLANSGTVAANGGTLTLSGTVGGPGQFDIGGGTLACAAGFIENVTFTGTAGTLRLTASRSYSGQVSGFSLAGGESLDLMDVGFASAGEASFTGTAIAGVLTVTDGTHTAHITLEGDYLSTTFIASSDDHGGTIVVASSGAGSATLHGLIAAMAGLGGSAGDATHLRPPSSMRDFVLAGPHVMAV